MLYGKHHASMYTGSMVGKGSAVFAVMGYVISNMEPDPEVGAQVELNPEFLGLVIGEEEKVIQRAIDFLCAPDPKSRSKDEEGRRLVRVGQFAYRVVNGVKYFKIRNAVESREKARERKAEYRDKVKNRAVKKGKPSPGEPGYVEAVDRGGDDAGNAYLDKLDRLQAPEVAVVTAVAPVSVTVPVIGKKFGLVVNERTGL